MAVTEPISQVNVGTSESPDVRDINDKRVGLASSQKAGMVKPDGDTTTIDEDGTLHASGNPFKTDSQGFISFTY